MNDLTYILLFFACLAGVGIDIALPYYSKLREWERKCKQADQAGTEQPEFDVFWPHGKRFNKAYAVIGGIDFLVVVGIVYGLLFITQRQFLGDAFDFIAVFWWAYGQNRFVNEALSGKITSAEQLRK